MAGARLRPIGPENPVPPRKIESEIGIGFVALDRVMHAMHIRRYDEPPKPTIHMLRNRDVAVIEHRGRIQNHFKCNHSGNGCAKCGDGGDFYQCRDKYLQRMKTRAGGEIEIEVRVMHPMKPPQKRDRVKHHVLEVDDHVERNYREHERACAAETHRVQEAPSLLQCEFGKSQRCDAQNAKHENRIERGDSQIAGPTHDARQRERPARRGFFPRRHRREHHRERAQPNRSLPKHGSS